MVQQQGSKDSVLQDNCYQNSFALHDDDGTNAACPVFCQHVRAS